MMKLRLAAPEFLIDIDPLAASSATSARRTARSASAR
jgi:hypothetical protein